MCGEVPGVFCPEPASREPIQPSANEKKMRVPMMDRVEQEIRIHSGHRIIENDGQSSLHLTIDEFNRRRLYYIQNSKKNKSPHDHCGGAGKEGHRDQIPHDLVDHDPWAVLLGENDASPCCCSPGQ
jgi:hypothetical protein